MENLLKNKVPIIREDTKEEIENVKKPKRKRRFLKVTAIFLGIVVLLAGVLVFKIGLPAISFAKDLKKLERKAGEAKSAVSTKDLSKIKAEIDSFEKDFGDLEKDFGKLSLLKIVPYFRNFYFDGEKLFAAATSGMRAGKIVITAVEPYQDFLGLTGGNGEDLFGGGEKTTEERINFLVKTVESLKPHLDELEKEIENINKNLAEIEVSKYPQEFKGMKIRTLLEKAKTMALEGKNFFSDGRPLLENLPWLLGKDKPRHFLFLFQNDGELRPTGGFWTAYGILKVENGKVAPLVSEDIYALDERLKIREPAPRPVKAYHKNVYYLNIRDINLSPDFKVSVDEFMKYYKTIKSNYSIDAVFAIDTQVLVDVLKVLGRVGVSGWGNFEAEPDNRCWGCPQVVYQLELLADKPLSTINVARKGFLAPLMHSIIANILGSPKEKLTKLIETALSDLRKKDILVYFFDENLQKAAESLKIAGRIEETKNDYFHLNDANFAGAKSNLFIEQTVKQEINLEKGKIIKKVTVEYKNTAPASNCNLEKGELCLNGLYRNWFRFYVPAGSKLIKMTGSEVDTVVYEELGKTVFEGFYGNKYPLYPEGSARVTVEYELPFSAEDKVLPILVQKQPGTKAPRYEFWVNGGKQVEFNLTEDRTVSLGI